MEPTTIEGVSPRIYNKGPEERLGEPLLATPPQEAASPAPPRPGEGTAPLTMQEQQTRSLQAAGINLAKSMLGVGMLALPKVCSHIGIATTLIALAVVAGLTFLSLHYCAEASTRTGRLRYSDVVKEHTGLLGQTLLDLALIINSFGLLVVAQIVVGDILVGDAPGKGLLSKQCGDRATVLAVVAIVLVAPMVSVTTVRSVTGASLVGVAAIMAWAILTCLFFIIALTNGRLEPVHWWPKGRFVGHGFESATQTIAVLPIVLVAFTGHQSLQHVLRDLQYVRGPQLNRIAAWAVTLCAVAYAAIAVFSFGLFGSDVNADVLRNFTVDALSPLLSTHFAQGAFIAVRVGFLISLLGTFPLQMAALRDSLWKLLFRQELYGPGLWLVTYGLLAAVYVTAASLESIWEILVVIGSTAGVLIALIFPGLLAIRMPETLTEPYSASTIRASGGSVLIIFGLIIGVFGLIRVSFYRGPLDA